MADAICEFASIGGFAYFIKPIEIGEKGRFYFIGKIQNTFIAAFACYRKAVIFKPKIVFIKSYKLAYANSRPQKQRENRRIAFAVFLLITFLTSSKVFAVFGFV